MKKVFLVLFTCVIVLSACTSKNETYEKTTYALGTIIDFNINEGGSDEVIEAMIEELNRIEAKMSVNIEDSEIMALNNATNEGAYKVSSELYMMLETSVYYGQVSGGGFDISLGPIIDLWGIGTEEERLPEAFEIDALLPLVGYDKILLLEDNMVYMDEGMKLDLGGIAKGYAADQLVNIAENSGVTSGFINLGGNVVVIGKKEDDTPYNIGVQNPFEGRNAYIGFVSVSDKTVVTSGDYERYFDYEGVRYHHLFDAKTGYPSQSDVIGVSIVADSSMDADALSTAVFILGKDAGLKLIEEMEQVECVVITKDSDLYMTDGFKEVFTLTDESYTIKESPSSN